jgi:hypothetical protein
MPHDKGPARAQMTANEAAIRKAYQVAEDKDVAGRANGFKTEGTFTDESIGSRIAARNPTAPSRCTQQCFPTYTGSYPGSMNPETRWP